jgi:arginase family enzyme
MGSLSLAELRRSAPRSAGQQLLATIPASASILVHLDIDVFRKQDMPAAYFPHPEGMNFVEGEELLRVLLQDARVRLIEISEYASLRDQDQSCVNKLVDLLCTALRNNREVSSGITLATDLAHSARADLYPVSAGPLRPGLL